MEKRVGHEIKVMSHLLDRKVAAIGRAQGADEVTRMHGWIIAYLYDNADKTVYQKDIESKFSVCRSTVTAILKRMEQKGYLVRHSVPQDARLKRLELTEKGISLHENIRRGLELLERQICHGVTEADRRTFFRVLEQMQNNLKDGME